MESEKQRPLKTTDTLWGMIGKISRVENRSINKQLITFLKAGIKKYLKDNPDFETNIGQPSKMTIKELTQLFKTSSEQPFKKRVRILIVDDSQIETEIYKEYLQIHNCEVTVAYSGAKALEIFKDKNNEYDFVVVDYKLPDTNGNQLLKELQVFKQTFHTIVVTSDLRPFIKTSFDDCNPAPVEIIEKSTDSLEKVLTVIRQFSGQ